MFKYDKFLYQKLSVVCNWYQDLNDKIKLKTALDGQVVAARSLRALRSSA